MIYIKNIMFQNIQNKKDFVYIFILKQYYNV